MTARPSPTTALNEALRAAPSVPPILYSTDGSEDFALDPVEQAIADIAAGRPIVVVDDEDRENEGDLVVAAEKVTPEIVAFMMSECRGLICAPMEGDELDRLKLPQMVDDNTESMKTAFTVSVDASGAHGVTTGISASDRATTLQLLASGAAEPTDLVRPGHIFPLRARTEASSPATATPRPPSTSPGSLDCARPERSSRSPARTAGCSGCPS